MLFLVENCFHWIGFHVVDFLLENGHKVDGSDNLSTDKKEHLSMFVGRNKSFTHVTDIDAAYDWTITINEGSEMTITMHNGRTTRVKLPLIFGEWMPMKQEGVYRGDKLIPFDSDCFLTEAVFIDDFLKSLIQWVESSHLSPVLEVRSIYKKEQEDKRLENSIYVRNNRPINDTINIVKKHYETYGEFY